MKTTSYLIEKRDGIHTLKCIDGPHKCGLRDLTAEADESSLIDILIGLGVPESECAKALQELGINQKAVVTFDANLR